MTNIGSGPSIGSGPKVEVNTVRAVSTTDAGAAAQQAAQQQSAQTPAATSSQGAAMVATTALNAGQIPVDNDRVATIKKAIQSGNYPIVPTKISDAMIAAGLMLRVAK
jgi:negative regulator of flagellin synthesis FlgM